MLDPGCMVGMLPVPEENDVEFTAEEIRRMMIEQAKNISHLADQVTDRRVRIVLIGLALKLLDAMEMESASLERKVA